MSPPNQKKIKSLHGQILRWYRKHKRELDWRTTTDPYHILVSEIMLQQTQVSRVQAKLPVFLRKFPTLTVLAKASRADVIHAWQGMGYNNRAVRLREMAKIIVGEYGSKIPSDVESLRTLPGIGPYTAHAAACFAFHKRVPVVDVNIRRVLSRTLWKMKHPLETKKEAKIWAIAGQILPRNAYEWNQALMDLGSVICTSKKPLCGICPVQAGCASRHLARQIRKGELHTSPKKFEPVYDGIPQRIWRGRIVDALRASNGNKPVPIVTLGKKIRPEFGRRELPWLQTLLFKLERDGIVDRADTFVRLSVK